MCNVIFLKRKQNAFSCFCLCVLLPSFEYEFHTNACANDLCETQSQPINARITNIIMIVQLQFYCGTGNSGIAVRPTGSHVRCERSTWNMDGWGICCSVSSIYRTWSFPSFSTITLHTLFVLQFINYCVLLDFRVASRFSCTRQYVTVYVCVWVWFCVYTHLLFDANAVHVRFVR